MDAFTASADKLAMYSFELYNADAITLQWIPGHTNILLTRGNKLGKRGSSTQQSQRFKGTQTNYSTKIQREEDNLCKTGIVIRVHENR